jgi:sugar transferase (PEP-CTERM/EpsH1 system associated)
MNIFYITDYVPFPPNLGAPLRNYNLLMRLAREHDIWLAAFIETPQQAEGVATIRKLCRAVETVDLPDSRWFDRPIDFFRYLLAGMPPDFRFYYKNELYNKIKKTALKIDFDVIQIDHSYMGIYLETLPPELHSRAVWALHDIDWIKYKRISKIETRHGRKFRNWLHSKMIHYWQPKFAAHFGSCITVSQSDKKALLDANPYLNVDIIPNGVDTTLYKALPLESLKPNLVFVGNMDYHPNADAVVHFCQEVLPLIRHTIKNVQLWIVGMNPRPEVMKLDGNGVHVTGKVDDVRPYYERCTTCVIPLRAGSGTRLKILEAMSLGRPVVSTSIGCEGLEVVDGEHILIADNPAEFAAATIKLLTTEALAKHLVHNARKLVKEKYDWEVLAKRLIRIYKTVSSNFSSRKLPGYQLALK